MTAVETPLHLFSDLVLDYPGKGIVVRKVAAASYLSFALLLNPLWLVGASAQSVCSGVEGNDPEIAAAYVDNFAGFHSVGGEAWLSFGSGHQLIFHICSVDNVNDFLIAQNSAGNDFNPQKYSRFEWFGKDGQLFYCQQVFDAATPADAADFNLTPAADSSDANDKGCGQNGQSPWSQLVLIRR